MTVTLLPTTLSLAEARVARLLREYDALVEAWTAHWVPAFAGRNGDTACGSGDWCPEGRRLLDDCDAAGERLRYAQDDARVAKRAGFRVVV